MAGLTTLSFTMTKARLNGGSSSLPNVASEKTDAYVMSPVHLSIGMHRK
jgi:hypothetical protein